MRAADVLAEKVAEFRASEAGDGHAAALPIALFNYAGGSEAELDALVAAGCSIIVNGAAAHRLHACMHAFRCPCVGCGAGTAGRQLAGRAKVG